MKNKKKSIRNLKIILSLFPVLIMLAVLPLQDSIKNGRIPAMNLEKYDLNLYKDYFLTDKYGKKIAYNLSIDFWSNKNDEKIKAETKQAAQDAFNETFLKLSLNDPKLQKSFTKLLKENLLQSFMNRFVRRLRFFKIIHGKFNIRFNFTPKKDNPNSFENEFSSNQLMHKNKDNNLYDYLKEKSPRIEELVYKSSLYNLETSHNEESYQFRGGSIHINIELLDILINPSSPIPNPFKNAVKGTITFRRYFKVNLENIAHPKHQFLPVLFGYLSIKRHDQNDLV